jgi:uncharacterized protein YuzE
MTEPEFGVSLETDKRTGALLAVYFQIRKGKAATVEEVADGAAFANYDRKGRLIGIELLGPCEVKVLNRLAAEEPPKYQNRIKSFLRNSIPRKMVLSA